jgi:hypothetical protein
MMSHHQDEEQNHNIMIAEFEYLETTVTDQNCIHQEVHKSRLNSWNACYPAFRIIFPCAI